MHKVRIGTRGSPLALWQAHFVRDTLASHFPDHQVELVILDTKGDQIRAFWNDSEGYFELCLNGTIYDEVPDFEDEDADEEDEADEEEDEEDEEDA